MKKHRPVPRTRTFRVVAWANIITQLLFPVAASLTPVWVSAAAKTQNEIQYTQVYKLKAGETVASVAKRHHLTVNQLKKVNQFRTFSKPFNALSAGDEIDIPWDNAPGVSDTPSTDDTARSSDVFWADSSTQVANALKSGDPSKVALDKARGLATDAATQEIQHWLKGYGTARVKLGVDDKARLEGSELDLLLPLYDTQNQLTYTQMGLRHVDKRTTTNIGVGQRVFLTDQMVGYNTFLDHDISGNHTRMGVGAEYWRDYLKLGANGYFRLSGWRNADNLEGYDARPANGFDLRGEAYLPAYPQLGGKLMYEQYFGDEVGLFGKTKRQKDPGAVTLGVNYTPFPLLTVGIDRRQGTDHGGETQFNLGLRYELGTPWAKQVDTSSVSSLRSLAGSRYDLVDRNNQIVLEYRKQEQIRLA
uniref:inverse autotransporter beta domain-containing protein n=1 Tax=Providencia sp. PROV117 TaxID=2949828 RepID=UPI00234A640F